VLILLPLSFVIENLEDIEQKSYKPLFVQILPIYFADDIVANLVGTIILDSFTNVYILISAFKNV